MSNPGPKSYAGGGDEQFASIVALHVAFPLSEQGRHAGFLISELDNRPACTPTARSNKFATLVAVSCQLSAFSLKTRKTRCAQKLKAESS